jgi:hypothetical protein
MPPFSSASRLGFDWSWTSVALIINSPEVEKSAVVKKLLAMGNARVPGAAATTNTVNTAAKTSLGPRASCTTLFIACLPVTRVKKGNPSGEHAAIGDYATNAPML